VQTELLSPAFPAVNCEECALRSLTRPPPEYASGIEVRRIRTNGDIKWNGGRVWVSSVLVGEPIGLEVIADGLWRVSYGPVELGALDAKGRLRPLRARGDVLPQAAGGTRGGV
jgi:hypothetical protein